MTVQIGSIKVVDSPVGRLAISATKAGVCKLDFLSGSATKLEFAQDPDALAHCESAASWLKGFFSGYKADYDSAIDISGTDFQRAVWNEIASIGFGEVKTYGDIAKAIGRPQASRAVGAAVGSNPLPLIIPCHRVLGANAKITGYSGGDGLPTKRMLLKHEAIGYQE